MVVKPVIFYIAVGQRLPILRAYDGLQAHTVKLGNELNVDDLKWQKGSPNSFFICVNEKIQDMKSRRQKREKNHRWEAI